MNTKAIILILSLLTLYLPLSATAAFTPPQTFQAEAVWGSPQSPIVASPGSSNLPLSITIINLGPSPVTNVTATFDTAYPLVPVQGQPFNLTQYVPSLPPGSAISLFGYFSVYESAKQGVYNETITLNYLTGNSATTEKIGVSVAVLGPSQGPQTFEASAVWGSPGSPIVAAPDSTNLPLVLTVYNVGPKTVFNFTLTFNPSSPITSVQGQSTHPSSQAPVLPVGSSITLLGYYNIAAGTGSGLYNQSITLHYSNGTQNFIQSLTVGVPVLGSANIQLSSFNYIPTVLYPGYPSAELQVYLINTGTAPATNVNVSLSTAEPVYPLYAGSTTRFIGFLPVGQPVPVVFPLGITNTSTTSNTTLSLRVNYNGVGSASFAIPFQENPKAVLEITSVSTPTVNIGDTADYITLTISNMGGAAAEGTSITLVPSNVFQPSIPSSSSPLLATTYLNASAGTILPGESAQVTYVVTVNPNIAAGTYQLTFVGRWIQSGASLPFVQQFTVSVPVHQSFIQSFGSELTNPIVIVIIALLLVLIIVSIVLAVRSRRRKS